jgi:general secretion pathway protein C
LYQNPQSLADVVTISAVRENGELLGYRIAPGKEKEQFELLGFQAGDLVTGVNGIALNDPANTLQLYQTMRSASEAVFDLQREDQPLTISVTLGNDEEGQ